MQDSLTTFKLVRKVKLWADCKKKKGYIYGRSCIWEKNKFYCHRWNYGLWSDCYYLAYNFRIIILFCLHKQESSLLPGPSKAHIYKPSRAEAQQQEGPQTKGSCWGTLHLSQESLSPNVQLWSPARWVVVSSSHHLNCWNDPLHTYVYTYSHSQTSLLLRQTCLRLSAVSACIILLAVCRSGAYPRLLGIHFGLTTSWTWGHGAAAASPLSGCRTWHYLFSSNIKYMLSGNHHLNA